MPRTGGMRIPLTEAQKQARRGNYRRYRERHLEESRAKGRELERRRRAAGLVEDRAKPCLQCGKMMDRHSKLCRSCYLSTVVKSAEEHRQNHRDQARQWMIDHPEDYRTYHREYMRKAREKWAKENPEKQRVIEVRHREKVRRETMMLLGGVFCAMCGFDDKRALQIDHIEGGGVNDPMRLKPWRRLSWIRDHQEEARQIYQVLCANCNWIKRWERKEFFEKGSPYAPSSSPEPLQLWPGAQSKQPFLLALREGSLAPARHHAPESQ